MKFSYHKVPLQKKSDFFGTHLLKPIIPVKVGVEGNKVGYAALIDSGADFCIFDAEIGEYLGLQVRNGLRSTFGGIQEAGESEVFFHKVTLVVGGWEHDVDIGFSYQIAKHGYGILDQSPGQKRRPR